MLLSFQITCANIFEPLIEWLSELSVDRAAQRPCTRKDEAGFDNSCFLLLVCVNVMSFFKTLE
jgi:hypothetical protein